ncbi:hypothetical protein K2Z83_04405 [Oscillochloris sp. ZM17-4]|uniref:CPBP family glutamic-type intramembrane protease n=1 Tax=Oscillochloris sp. ZM17-4 TaxID=2866714 RepID=UPI001C739552|nr:CPBP family glutamic-type intramembrane protease [Oscillochloris sp. ZM17-4]MBX0326924.1 hypothetical protein [Oscillochloris sp. ZM17-4]
MTTTAQLLYAAASYLALWGVSWWGAVGRGWGAAESAHDPASVWMYVRRLLLASAALVGVGLVGGAELSSFGWGLSPWLLAALAVGALMGFGNRGGFVPSGPVPVALALFHTFATELYFRGYLFHHLGTIIGLWSLPLSALAYGLYYLTVHTVWAGGRRARLIGPVTFSILGLLFAGGYTLCGGFLGAWGAHFGAVLRWRGGAGHDRAQDRAQHAAPLRGHDG